MSIFLVVTFLFFVGSIIGWSLELFWRRFFSKNNPEKKWINPGFLIGPYLPLYGFCLCILFLLSFINVSFIGNPILQKIVLFTLMAACITIFEYIAGLIFIKGMKIKLWDYSNCFGNIKGIICPQYSFYWILLSGIYYFFIHHKRLEWLYWFTNNISFSFVIGFFYGVFFIDVCVSLNLLNKIRKFAKENKLIVLIESFKQDIRRMNDEIKSKPNFIFSFKLAKHSLLDSLKKHIERRSENRKD